MPTGCSFPVPVWPVACRPWCAPCIVWTLIFFCGRPHVRPELPAARRPVWLPLLLLALVAAMACSLAAGPLGLAPGSIRGRSSIGPKRRRYGPWCCAPVAAGAAGGLVGAALGSAGGAFQAVLRNPLADPYILGVSGGAALGAVSATALGLRRPLAVPAAAFSAPCRPGGGLRVARAGRSSPHTLILAGVMIGSLPRPCSSFCSGPSPRSPA